MGSWTAILLAAATSGCLNAEQPIVQPGSMGWGFDGPALSLECVALLKADPKGFPEAVRQRSPERRRACVNELLESLTPEPAFTAEDFRKAIVNGGYMPDDRELGLRMTWRLGVNYYVAQALSELALLGLIDGPNAIPPLIHCLNHPWLEVSRRCENTLVAITRHSYGWGFYYNQPPPPTEEGRQRFVADWAEWEQQMQSGHPIFDDWLASECLQAVHQVGQELTAVLKGTVAASYINNFQDPRLSNFGGEFSESIFEFGVGINLAANWPRGSNLDWVGIKMLRPGVTNPRSIRPEFRQLSSPLVLRDPTPEKLYRENFNALDLEIDVEIDSHDDALRNASFLAVQKALGGLRDANKSAAAKP